MTSTAVDALAYDAADARLRVRFRSGEAYAYADVPAAVFEGFLAAPSKGRYFHAEVDGRYAYRRLG